LSGGLLTRGCLGHLDCVHLPARINGHQVAHACRKRSFLAWTSPGHGIHPRETPFTCPNSSMLLVFHWQCAPNGRSYPDFPFHRLRFPSSTSHGPPRHPSKGSKREWRGRRTNTNRHSWEKGSSLRSRRIGPTGRCGLAAPILALRGRLLVCDTPSLRFGTSRLRRQADTTEYSRDLVWCLVYNLPSLRSGWGRRRQASGRSSTNAGGAGGDRFATRTRQQLLY